MIVGVVVELGLRPDGDAPLPRCCPHHAFGLGTCSACGGVGFVRADDVTERAQLAERLQVPVLQLCVRCGLGWRRGGVC